MQKQVFLSPLLILSLVWLSSCASSTPPIISHSNQTDSVSVELSDPTDQVSDPLADPALASDALETRTILGTITQLPSNDRRLGTWQVDDYTVLVIPNTTISGLETIAVGDSVWVVGVIDPSQPNRILARRILESAGGSVELSSRLVISGLNQPLYVTSPPEDANRLFIVEQKTGRIRLFDRSTETLQTLPYLTIPSEDLLTPGFEQGLLGLAFHPDFASNGTFYVNYTAPGGGDSGQTKLVEYQADPTSNRANAASARTLLTIPQPEENHNGGWIGFGPDGYLYWATGDGGGSGFVPGIPSFADNSQDITDNLLGKILRLDVDGADAYPADPDRNYAIPADNPFVGFEGDDEIWVYGLRNPWRASFDPLTQDLYIADVGQDDYEEINVQLANSPGGENYGWNIMEGSFCYPPSDPLPCDQSLFELPVYEYPHSIGQSITGGYVYRGSNTRLNGSYFFADFIAGRIWTLKVAGSSGANVIERTEELQPDQGSIRNVASFGQDADGNLYIVDLAGSVFQILVDES